MSIRKLASVQRIKSLSPIEGADAIQKALVLGWQLVVRKDEFQIGDLVVYCEIDSVLPKIPVFELINAKTNRIKTIRLRGQISQGICFPLSILPTGLLIEEGLDVTEMLGIEKFEPPIPACLSGVMKGNFPSFIPKTDEVRVQNFEETLIQFQGIRCYIAEKVDGASTTYFIRDGEFGVASRNMELCEDDENSLWKVARALEIEQKLRSLNVNVAIQGELVGEGIQSNRLKFKGQTFLAFNLFLIDKYQFVDFEEFIDTMKTFNIPTVPILNENYLLETDVNVLIKLATIKSSIHKETWAEGIVIRSVSQVKGKGRISFKAINPEFLLKFGE